MSYPLVEITWGDAAGFSEWRAMSKIREPEQPLIRSIVSVGFLVHETPDYVVVCSAHDAVDDSVSSCDAIPVGMIRERQVLREVRPSLAEVKA